MTLEATLAVKFNGLPIAICNTFLVIYSFANPFYCQGGMEN
jgi:hypothetical protein